MSQPREKWFVKYWRPAAAWVYLLICLFDFVLMPIYVARTNLRLPEIIAISQGLRDSDRLTAITTLLQKNAWTPITVSEGGLLHISFAAILGVAAWTRGRVQEAQVRNGGSAIEEPVVPVNRNTAANTVRGSSHNVDNPDRS
jgi:hypothetical protein